MDTAAGNRRTTTSCDALVGPNAASFNWKRRLSFITTNARERNLLFINTQAEFASKPNAHLPNTISKTTNTIRARTRHTAAQCMSKNTPEFGTAEGLQHLFLQRNVAVYRFFCAEALSLIAVHAFDCPRSKTKSIRLRRDISAQRPQHALLIEEVCIHIRTAIRSMPMRHTISNRCWHSKVRLLPHGIAKN